VAILYLRSTDGSDADSGATWALAKATLAGAFTAAAAGDTIYVSQAHAETQASAMTLTSPGTAASPVKVICVNDAAEPPTAVATTATITTTSTSSITFAGFAWVYGITFNCGTGAGISSLRWVSTAPYWWRYKTCKLKLLGTNTASIIEMDQANLSSDSRKLEFLDCDLVFSDVGHNISVNSVPIRIRGGTIAATGSVPTTLFKPGSGSNVDLEVRGVDLAAFGSGKSLVQVASLLFTGFIRFLSCKLGASVSLTTGTPQGQGGLVVWLDNADSGDTNYRMQRHQYEGDVYSETVVVRNGGATDGTTRLSWKMVTSTNQEFISPLPSPEIAQWNETTGSAKTLTLSIISTSTTLLNDDEVWIEVEYCGTNGFPLTLFADDSVANILATPAAQATDTGSNWSDLVTARANLTLYAVGDFVKVASNPGRVFRCTTAGTTGVSEPAGFATAVDGGSVTDATAGFQALYRQQLNVTVTPQEKGFFIARVMANKTTTVYADPILVVSGGSASARQSLYPGGAYINQDAAAAAAGGGAHVIGG